MSQVICLSPIRLNTGFQFLEGIFLCLLYILIVRTLLSSSVCMLLISALSVQYAYVAIALCGPTTYDLDRFGMLTIYTVYQLSHSLKKQPHCAYSLSHDVSAQHERTQISCISHCFPLRELHQNKSLHVCMRLRAAMSHSTLPLVWTSRDLGSAGITSFLRYVSGSRSSTTN